MPASFVEDLQGQNYLHYIRSLHERMKPRTYLEIGTRSGDSLALTDAVSIAIDPAFAISADVIGRKPACLFFQTTSDEFFRNFDPMRLLGGSIDLAFLDGLHLFEVLLRDFINTERSCRSDSVILMHDCIPSDVYMAERIDDPVHRHRMGSKQDWWAGDVWKIAPILQRWRPDIELIALDCVPTGLLVAAGLDPASTVLADRYGEIVAEFAEVDLSGYGLDRFHAGIGTQRAEEARLPVAGWRIAEPAALP
ncbi:MAG TPA: class I SAM-dependent methyltransferase [Acidiphilium sp.]